MARQLDFFAGLLAPAFGHKIDTPCLAVDTAEALQLAVHGDRFVIHTLSVRGNEVFFDAHEHFYRMPSGLPNLSARGQVLPISEEVGTTRYADRLLAALEGLAALGTSPLATPANVERARAERDRLERFAINREVKAHHTLGGTTLEMEDEQGGSSCHVFEAWKNEASFGFSMLAKRGRKLDRAVPAFEEFIKAAIYEWGPEAEADLRQEFEQMRAGVARRIDSARASQRAEREARKEIVEGDLLVLRQAFNYKGEPPTQVVSATYRRTPRGKTVLRGLFLDEQLRPTNSRVQQSDLKGARKLDADTVQTLDRQHFSAHARLKLQGRQREIEAERERRSAAAAA
ncbi:hypothetical protein [Tranquillimonas alkanivorans]|uniref:Uncharacterized protein n=1 Tax=Tranquillimonas alkanivorans TaxID=441119 RepID=A0A1I5TTT8_9RHOB|nr:hypothetical protein [Tranquillimonas alkanivorans]SFP86398.1 hypothetical protein SAMN04488047_11522 [Tranquillimonas alkanivorans]